MKPWSRVVTPHVDIRAGRLDESVFAADLSDVVADRGPLEYRDAATFFRKTFPTQGLVNLLSAVLGRLAGKGTGEAVIQIQTPFGGGKTHSLIALYHLLAHGRELSGREPVTDILHSVGVDEIPSAAVVAFVGTAADALHGRTPWGELAHQLGRYDLLGEHDRKRRTPGKDLLHELLRERPTLILMDEIAEYAVKARDFRDQVVAFCQELTETVKVLPQCVLAVTLPSSAPYGEDGERALHELQQVFKRVEAIKTPVEGEEIFEVIRRRLFEDIGDPSEMRATVEEFFELYQRLGDDVPRAMREPAYRERMRKAYPFHPELIDILFERWSTFPDFQRTRGVLRLLAQLVAELYQAQHPAPLLLPAHVNLANPAVRGELLRHIGNEYQGVIAADIAGQNAKAEKIDREMGSEYARFGVASGLARAIFFASFSGGEKRGVGIQRLRLALAQPGLPPAIIGDALRRLEDELWYLHVEGGSYWFSSQPNLNRVIVEKEEAVKPEQITEELRERLEKLAGREMRVTLWPHTSQDVPDTRELKLAILAPEYTRATPATESVVRELLDKCGQNFRIYRNTLVVLVADAGELATARQQLKRYLAYRAIREDRTLMRQLTDDNKRLLENKSRDADSAIDHALLSAYRHAAKAGEDKPVWWDLGLPTVGIKPSLALRVIEYLRGEDLLLAKLRPRAVLEKAFHPEEQEKSIEQIYEAFLKHPNLPMLESKQVLLEAVAVGVRDSVFGVRVGQRELLGSVVPLAELGSDSVVVRETRQSEPAERGEGEKPVGGDGNGSPEGQGAGGVGVPPGEGLAIGVGPGPVPVAPGKKGVHTYRLRVSISWDKLSDFVRGVVMPLRQDGADLEVEVALQARKDAGINQATLDQKVRETLVQIGARILEERPE